MSGFWNLEVKVEAEALKFMTIWKICSKPLWLVKIQSGLPRNILKVPELSLAKSLISVYGLLSHLLNLLEFGIILSLTWDLRLRTTILLNYEISLLTWPMPLLAKTMRKIKNLNNLANTKLNTICGNCKASKNIYKINIHTWASNVPTQKLLFQKWKRLS